MLHLLIKLAILVSNTPGERSTLVHEFTPVTTWSDNAGHWHKAVTNQRTHAEDTCRKLARTGETWEDTCTRLGVIR